MQRAALPQPPVHFGLEEPHRAPAIALGAVERGVGIGEQHCRIRTVSRIDGDPDTQSGPYGASVHLEVGGHRSLQPFHQFLGDAGLHAAGDDDAELVAPEPREEFTASRCLQALCELA